MSADLKLLENLLMCFKHPSVTWAELASREQAIKDALARLNKAWDDEEITNINAGIAHYLGIAPDLEISQ